MYTFVRLHRTVGTVNGVHGNRLKRTRVHGKKLGYRRSGGMVVGRYIQERTTELRMLRVVIRILN
jgi:hypothetical protein